MDTNRKARAWGAATLLAVLIFFSPALFKSFIFRDAFNLFFPYKAAEAPFLRDFQVCLWNPWETMGSSFVGELSTAWFYPANIFYLIFSAGAAFRFYLVSHYVLAAFFMWLLLRDLKAGPAAAACGAFSYTLSGYLLSQNGMPDMLASAAWLPGALFFLNRYLGGRRLSWLCLFSAALAMPLLAGRAEGVLMNGAAALGFVLATPVLSGARSRARVIFLVLPAGALLALVLSMIQFLPSFELGRLSIKGAGFPVEAATLWSLHPLRLVEFLLASPWGRFWPEDNFNGSGLTGWAGHYPWSLSLYLGLPILAGCATALVRASWRERALAVGFLVLVILWSLGGNFALYPLAHRLFPPLRIFRYPEKYMVIAVFIIAVCGALGLDGIIAWIEAGPRRFAVMILAVICACLAVFTVVLNAAWPGGHLLRQCDHALLVILVFMFIVFISLYLGRAGLVKILLPVLVVLDLGLANHWIIPYADPGIYKFEPAALAIIRDHAMKNAPGLFDGEGRPLPGKFRVMREPISPSGPVLAMMEGESGFERYRRFERHTLAPNFNFMEGIEELTGYTAAATLDFDRVMKARLDVVCMELFNVRYVIGPAEGSWLDNKGLPLAGSRYSFGFKVFELPDAFPRAYLIGRSVRVVRSLDRLDLLGPHDFRESVILDDDPALPLHRDESELAMTPAELVSYGPMEVRIKTDADAAAFLVLSDSYYPGWEARVDGQPSRIFRANFLSRAVRVPTGAHEIVFRYRPASYAVGRALSACAILLMLVIFCRDVFRGGARRV